ncbi:hypothetical protein HYALB_00002184 [Hymenoscyphus albidus]|uniref:Zinc finger PHD-type domain-containing protein n=1 Tax=Hymenoscyphus albidus TaxID=595503 RepID=A0A9N9Q3B6_9HELO|nr:hypothetical protein HYALB_00002184 [Hymenoscyphus albidus]
MVNPDRIRERMDEQKDVDQAIWRIEPYGWDSEDRTYIVLDDNRLYRQTEPPPPPPAARAKKNSKKAKAASRASKRRRISEAVESEADTPDEAISGGDTTKEDDGLGGMKWECLAITLEDFNTFLATIEKSRDPNEKILRQRIVGDLLPILEKQEESNKRKAAQKERELLNLEKLATAKRSSRIAGKMESQKQEEEAREAERKRLADLAMAKKEQEKWLKLEKERESRMVTREQRLKEREARRILHEEELANLSEDSKKIEAGSGRLSERHLKAEIERKKQALEELAEEEDWIFDCICGAYGQIDDGTHSIACDKCNIWQHSKCVGVSQTEADREDFLFVCKTCERRALDEERAKNRPPIKIKLNRPGSSSASLPPTQNSKPVVLVPSSPHGSRPEKQDAPRAILSSPVKSSHQQNTPKMATWQPNLSHSAQAPQSSGPPASPQRQSSPILPPPKFNVRPNPGATNGTHTLSSPPNGKLNFTSPYPAVQPSSSHVFSSPHPNSPTNLPPPGQPPVYTFMNGSGINYNKTTPGQVSTGNGVNGNRNVRRDSNPFGSIANLPSSPFTGAPLLTPATKASDTLEAPASSKGQNPTPTMHTWKPNSSPPQAGVTSTVPEEQGQEKVLPPATMGFSPTKHSPPRSTASNTSFGSVTPSILPPVTSLSPILRAQNLSPPVKMAEPERSKVNGQASP